MFRLPPAARLALYRRPINPNNDQFRRTNRSMALTDSNVLKLAPDA
jgi:hypothetical protein